MWKQSKGKRVRMTAQEVADLNKEQDKDRRNKGKFLYKGRRFSSTLKDILEIDLLISFTAIDQIRTLQNKQWTLMDLQAIHEGISSKYLIREILI